MQFLIGFVVGAVGASVIGFFVWKNNKAKFSAVAEKLAEAEKKLEEKIK